MTHHEPSLARQTAFDEAKAKAFAGQMLTALNGAALALMASIGHRTWLFDEMAAASPCTSVELARRAKLAERYVREWLGVMVAARVVTYDPVAGTYTLPREHAAFLTREGSVKNLAATMQFPSVVSALEEEILARFHDGEGMHYHHYGRFHEVMGEVSYQTTVMPLVGSILPLVDGLTDRLEAGIDVADLGCGAGRALLLLAERFPRSRFSGIDLCEAAFAPAEAAAWSKGLRNLAFRSQDLSRGLDGEFDVLFAFDAIHDQADPQAVLRSAHKALRPGGVFLMVEFGASSRLENNLAHPIAPFLYMMSTMHCTPVSLGQGGQGLGAMWGMETATEMLERAGFANVTVTRLPHDPFNAYFVARP
ncbi:class I SAM-dependent methyltransferase [Rubellimicrobium roseum]|uniref:Methyltransferase domain-containing protein n=1 Tax=Rubellimicrobium roseum TaxID=687525 RepID=A0A5C4NDB2_9RHOB|nr:methyltransferase domain-containing protein [Rubellimicrobium roseum]TNC71298.1 methyltransferase domain-containing protein [Rubellimicrobium roseum]